MAVTPEDRQHMERLARLLASVEQVSPHPELGTALESAGFAVTEVADPGEGPHLLIARRDEARVDVLPAVVGYQQVADRWREASP